MTTADTWYNGPTLTLNSGTYLIIGQATVASAANTSQRVTTRLSNSSSVYYAESQQSTAAAGAGATATCTVTLLSVVTLTSQTTIRLEAASTSNNSVLKAEASDNSSLADSATRLIAAKVA
jgi:hypothetical protein